MYRKYPEYLNFLTDIEYTPNMIQNLGCQTEKRQKWIVTNGSVFSNTSPICYNRFSTAFNPAWHPNFESRWISL
jgi:hypothetical protein